MTYSSPRSGNIVVGRTSVRARADTLRCQSRQTGNGREVVWQQIVVALVEPDATAGDAVIAQQEAESVDDVDQVGAPTGPLKTSSGPDAEGRLIRDEADECVQSLGGQTRGLLCVLGGDQQTGIPERGISFVCGLRFTMEIDRLVAQVQGERQVRTRAHDPR